MQTLRPTFTCLALLAVLPLAFSGCAAFRTRVAEVDPEKKLHMEADYDYTDAKQLARSVADQLIAEFLAPQQETPVLIAYTIQPRTKTFVETKNLTDKIRTELIRSGKARFVNRSRRDDLLQEQNYQALHSTPETRAAVGKQLGAKYMLTGTLVEMSQKTGRQVRVSETEVIYYSLTMEVTDLETGEIAWTTEREIARAERRPLIGW
ncbi:MAG: penicillin-binding protein activator LpoB [Kiritimatiellae bacterium]|nr:penicillin-binding protein activator LpoB [Kiritimatiellia bacterium]